MSAAQETHRPGPRPIGEGTWFAGRAGLAMPAIVAASVIVSVTSAVEGAASSSHRRATSSAARGSTSAPMTSGRSSPGPRSIRV